MRWNGTAAADRAAFARTTTPTTLAEFAREVILPLMAEPVRFGSPRGRLPATPCAGGGVAVCGQVGRWSSEPRISKVRASAGGAFVIRSQFSEHAAPNECSFTKTGVGKDGPPRS